MARYKLTEEKSNENGCDVMPQVSGDPVGRFGETPGPKRRLTQPPYNSPRN
jgi:hypothetical protein